MTDVMKWLVAAAFALSACSSTPGPPAVFTCPEGFHIEFRQVRLTGEQPTCVSDDGRSTTEGVWK